MSDQPRAASQSLYEKAPSTRQAVKFMTAAAVSGSLLFLSGLTITATVIALIMATPVLVLFSPVLVPAAIAVFLFTVGFLFSGGCGVAAVSTLAWIYSYVRGKHPPGADQLDYAGARIANKAREYGQFVQHKAQEATGAS